MHKRIALIGCSHSDWKPENEMGSWISFLNKKYPNIKVDNYSASGHGHIYFDFILRYLRYSCKINYDLIIVQLTHPNRWMVPVHGYHNGKLFSCDSNDLDNAFEFEVYSEQYSRVLFKPARRVSGGIKLLDQDQINDDVYKLYYNQGNQTNLDMDLRNDEALLSPFTLFHSSLFFSYLKEITDIDDNLLYFTPRTIDRHDILDNNINQPRFADWLRKEKNIKNINDILDSTMHLDSDGNKLLFDEYLLTSKLGKKLDNLSYS